MGSEQKKESPLIYFFVQTNYIKGLSFETYYITKIIKYDKNKINPIISLELFNDVGANKKQVTN